jgi:hypothetical protein
MFSALSALLGVLRVPFDRLTATTEKLATGHYSSP